MQLVRQPSSWEGLEPEMRSALRQMWEQLGFVINGQVAFGSAQAGRDNIDGTWLKTTTPGGADTNFTLKHNLGRIPSGWLTVSLDKGAILYKGTTAWTKTDITLKCTVATVAVVIFVF